MNAEQIIAAASQGRPVPVGATTIDRALYFGLFVLYRGYRMGMFTRDEAAKEKTTLLKQYTRDKILERAMMHDAKLRVSLGEYLKQVDFNLCPLARIFDGREENDGTLDQDTE